MAGKSKSKAKAKATKTKTKGRGKKRATNVADYAGLSVKRTLLAPGGGNFVTNVLYNLMNTQLADYPRAVQVAAAYQHYRIKNIRLTIKPTFDTFSGVGPAVMSKMQFYYMIDKSGSIPTNVTLEGLKQMGARPIALDEKPITISWAPSVLESAMYAPGLGNNNQAKYTISPWLTCQNTPVGPGPFVPSGIDHLGIYWYNEQLVAAVAQPFQVEVEVQFQFKKPLAVNATGDVHAQPAQIAEINTSSDGIVGGADGV